MLVIVDTGCANLASVGFAFERLGVRPVITGDADTISKAERIILPGVGAMPYAMQALKTRGLVEVLRAYTRPLMGICLGMQMLFETSAEGGASGLGLIEGGIDLLDTDGKPAPHMGWNRLDNLADDPILAGISPGDYVYFVHSYAARVRSETIATSRYGQSFSAIVRRGNIYGCQFHPERSGKVGAQILQNFLKVET